MRARLRYGNTRATNWRQLRTTAVGALIVVWFKLPGATTPHNLLLFGAGTKLHLAQHAQTLTSLW
eukprot:11213890-Lingulodinium_polyedra.AAC.1